MKDKDLRLGLVVYQARVLDIGLDKPKDTVVVEEFTVTKAGKEFFELKGRRSRLAGAYRNMGDTLGRLELSPAAAVDNLERRKKAAWKLNEERYARKVIELDAHMQLIQDWRNKSGL